MRRKRIGITGLTLAPVAALLLIAGCSKGAPPAPPPPEVAVYVVRPQNLPNIVVLPGRVQAVRTAEVRARVNGIVERRFYQEGSDVRAGQPLFGIDPRELRASLSAVQATLARAQANAANARQDVDRYRGLIADQAISKQEYDAALARLRTAQADVAQASAQVRSAQLNLGYTTVNAPIAGRAGRAQVTEGALVSASEGTLLTTIEQIDTVYVNFSQSSANILALRRDVTAGRLNMPALDRIAIRLELEDGTIYGVPGHLDFLDLSIDERTGTAALRAEFANPGHLLLPGQFVRARINAGVKPGGIAIPQRAVKLSAQGGTVMVVGAKNVVETRPVSLGDLYGDDWIVAGGLKAGDRVIVDGLQKVREGMPVRIAASPARAAQPATKAR